ncbi:Aminodeoxyfutalosine deaminase [Rhodobacteraceae bacterium THAF1]|uniref:adenosine deaminase n=1 Tax=Palleronia sp. THAF1 TaxID=2587842 RepID=UPI000F402629|nr:adenosine deaminase [Palleronia sp. THAF1]QFU07312.1 Aminodeoxyfutalosine deaminase [Palleronia sp. THAF1]VDC20776.1 Aminodeoxyfutalosine deaminase [Rhodobacteraceae bacterium THAF1]
MKELPKVELHLHLEGAMPPAFARDMAKAKNVDISRIFDDSGAYNYDGFLEFLQVYEVATSVLIRPEDFAKLTRTVLEQSAETGVIYTEAFLSPDFCGGRDVGAWREYLHAIREAAEGAERDFGIAMRGIVTCIRHFGPDKAKETARCAAETAGDFITGFGMGGDEGKGRQGDFAYAFDMAREAGLRLTTHAGEWGGPSSVRHALDDLRVERIGHGVRAIEDPALVERLARDGVVLEVSPGSNVALGIYKWNTHPIEKLRAAGVPITVSTDDPPFFHTDMVHEYDRLAATFGWDEDMFRHIARVSIDAAFCDEPTRKRLHERIDA